MVRALAVILLALSGAASAAPRVIRLDAPPPRVDMDEVRRRTQAYEAQRAEAQAPAVSARRTLDVLTLLDAAQAEVGAPPGVVGRLAPGLWVADERKARLARAQARVEGARNALREVREAARRNLEALAARAGSAPWAPAVAARLKAERERFEGRAAEADRALAGVAESLADERGGVGGRLTEGWRRLAGRGAAARLDAARSLMRSWGVAREVGVLSADLTYVEGSLTSGPLSTTSVTPAYLAAVDSGQTLEDTTQGREVELTPELKAKAESLRTAKAAWDFVRNQMRLVWYYGSLKGAAQTLREGEGNNADLAALLVSLLRAQGTPARFVEGTIELPVGKLADLLGLLTEEELEALYEPPAAGPAFELSSTKRDLALRALSGAGIPYESVVEGGRVRAVRLSHVWVEAYLAVGDYRGTGQGRSGKQWMPLDPAVPGGAKYVARPPALDAFTVLGQGAAQLTRDFLTSGAEDAPLAFWRARVKAALAEKYPGRTYEDVQWRVEQRAETLALVPGALPYRVVAVHGEYAFLPETHLHRARIRAFDAQGVLFEATLPLHQLVGHRTVLTYRPASDLDADVISAAGGLYAAPASTVALLPSLRVGGVERAVATRPVGLGARHRWSLELLLPDGSLRRVENDVVAGNVVAVGLGGPRNFFEAPASPVPGDLDGPAAAFLYGRAVAYANAWTEAEEELARLTQVVALRPTANVVLVENALEVEEALGVRQRVVLKGVQVDADLRTLVPLALQPGRGADFLRLSGYEGSFRESAVLAEGVKEPAVSAVTLLQEAYRRGVAVVEVRQDNVDAALGSVQASSEVLRDVRDLALRGREVLVPAQPLTLLDWTGTGYVARNPETEEGGYFLSGRLSGGQTIISPAFWQDEALAQVLESPDAPASTDDVSRVARIFKVTATDGQRALVGKRTPRPIAVYVTTAEGIPVEGAPVTFRRAGKLKPLFGANDGLTPKLAEYTTRTDASGRSTAAVQLDTRVIEEAIAEQQPGQANDQLIGLNQVVASTVNNGTTIEIAFPFHLLAQPGPVAKVVGVDFGRSLAEARVETGRDLQVDVLDAYDNPLANQLVTWAQAPDTGAFVQSPNSTGLVRTLNASDSTQSKLLTQVTPTLGRVTVGYIPGPAPTVTDFRVQAVVARAEGGPVFAEHVFVAKDPDRDDIVLRLATPAQEAYDGAYAVPSLHFPVPFVGQLLQAHVDGADVQWVPLTGREFEFSDVSISMDVLDEKGNPVAGGHITQAPWVKQTVPSVDTESSVAFFMPYLVEDGWQTVRFTAHVRRTFGDDKNLAEGQQTSLTTRSRPVRLSLSRRTVSGQTQPCGQCTAVSVNDLEAIFTVTNPASYPLYLELVERPTIAGEVLLAQGASASEQTDANGRRVLLRNTTTEIHRSIHPGTSGGSVTARVFAPDPLAGPAALRQVAERVMQIAPSNVALARVGVANPSLQAHLILPVRNVASTRGDDEGATEPPIRVPAPLEFCAFGNGRFNVTSGSALVAAADVAVDLNGNVSLQPVPGVAPLLLTERQTLATLLEPGDPAGQPVRVQFEPRTPDQQSQTIDLTLQTRVEDAGALPVGHTFVKDVSVVDGHLMKQFSDLSVPGRGPTLSFARSYTSQGFENGPLGYGWTHSQRSYVIADPSRDGRYVVVGGEGGGQVYTCNAQGQACKTQAGYHGTFRREDTADGKPQFVFRSKGGVTYRYTGLNTSYSPARYQLQSVTDPAGRTLVYEYGGAEAQHEVVRVWEAGNRRYLQLRYAWPKGLEHTQLTSVELFENPRAPVPLAADQDGSSLGACVRFDYQGDGHLSAVERLDAGCNQPGTVMRRESFTYVKTADEGLKNNLETYTDPNGVVTRYEWYAKGDVLPGEEGFLRFGDKQERVRRVVEPLGAETSFVYSLLPKPQSVLGAVVDTFETSVTGPRPDVPATVYRVDAYGGATYVARPVSEGRTASSTTAWDKVHVRPTAELDARGRTTQLRYDDFGNLIERRTLTPILKQGGPDTEPLTDGDGNPVASVVERWAYDPAFGQPICHVDTEGRVTRFELDSDGFDPRASVPSGTGQVLRTRRLAATVPVAQLASTLGCLDLAGGLSTSAQDIVTERHYCGVRGVACPPGALKGDLVVEVDGEGHERTVTAYDVYGFASDFRQVTSGGRTVTTSLTYDARGRLTLQRDDLGQYLTQGYDALDRRTSAVRRNLRKPSDEQAASPGETQGWTYYPGGQVHVETNGTPGFTRTHQLDARGRVERVEESGGSLTSTLVTRYTYDEADNRTSVTDRRGVTTTSTYDWDNRVVAMRVSVAEEDRATFVAQGGALGSVGRDGLVAEYGYDDAGNKLYEVDLHGHRTDFVLDPLYRVVKTLHPEVPGTALEGGVARYETRRRYDRTGNVTLEVDGNGNSTRMQYDFAGRLSRTDDAAGRYQTREYDRDGNLSTERSGAGSAEHLVRTSQYDDLHRVLLRSTRAAGPEPVTFEERTDYDDKSHTVAVRDARGFVTLTALDDVGRVMSETRDANHALRSPTTPEAGPALNLTTTYAYDANGRRTHTTDALGRTTEAVVDALGRVTALNRPMGVTETFTLDGEGKVVQHVDGRGVKRQVQRDPLGRERFHRLYERFSSDNEVSTVAEVEYRDAAGPDGLVSSTAYDHFRHGTTTRIDALHREVQVEDALGGTIDNRYDASNLRRTRDQRGYVTESRYDAVGRRTYQADLALDGKAVFEQTFAFDDVARTVTAKDRNGVPAVDERDGLGRVVRHTRSGGAELQATLTAYDALGNAVRVTDPNGHLTRRDFDGAGRLIAETAAFGTPVEATTHYTYDAVGNRTLVRGPRATAAGFDVRESYDDLNRAVRTEDALGRVTLRAYDAAGKRVCEKRPLGEPTLGVDGARGLTLEAVQEAACTGSHVTRFTYEEDGKLTSVVDALGGAYTFVYDRLGNLLAKQDANGHLTTYEYDALNRRTAEHQHLDAHVRQTAADRAFIPLQEPLDLTGERGTLTWQMAYDAAGNLLTLRDPKGELATHTYGVLNRLGRTDYTDHAAPRALPSLDSMAYVYDGNGNATSVSLTKATDAGPLVETTTRFYDSLDRLRTEVRPDGKRVAYNYDAKGNRTRVTDTDGVATAYLYDARDRLEVVTLPEGGASYRYFPDGLLKGSMLPNGVHEGRCYDDAGQLKRLVSARGTVADDCTTSAVRLSEYVLEYDADGNRSSQAEMRTAVATGQLAAEATTYGYDGLDRLVAVRYPDTTTHLYRLDAVGNRTGERRTRPGVAAALAATAFEAVRAEDLTHDITSTFNRADLVFSRTDAVDASRNATFLWDENGNLTSKRKPDSKREFRWDVRNTLVSVLDDGQEVGRYDYNERLDRTRRRTAQERVEYVLDDGHVLQEADGALAGLPTRRRYHYGGGPLAVVDTPRAVAGGEGATGSSATSFLSTDALGSVTDATDASGAVRQARKYDAWGGYRSDTAPKEGDFKLGFTGHQFDPETGLVYARARYFDPELGQFISRDSYEGQLADAPSLHRFAYAHGNPTRYRDRDGHSATLVGGVAGLFWGFGQMIGGMAMDIANGHVKDSSDYFGLWGQNILGGLEIGASIDLTLASGGTLAVAGSGALGGAGFNALTFNGQGKSAQEFWSEQKEGAAWGAAGGVLLGKALPLLAKAPGVRQGLEKLGETPMVKQAVEKLGEVGSKLVARYTPSAGDAVITGAPNLFKKMGIGLGEDLAAATSQGIQEGAAEGVAALMPDFSIPASTSAGSGAAAAGALLPAAGTAGGSGSAAAGAIVPYDRSFAAQQLEGYVASLYSPGVARTTIAAPRPSLGDPTGLGWYMPAEKAFEAQTRAELVAATGNALGVRRAAFADEAIFGTFTPAKGLPLRLPNPADKGVNANFTFGGETTLRGENWIMRTGVPELVVPGNTLAPPGTLIMRFTPQDGWVLVRTVQ